MQDHIKKKTWDGQQIWESYYNQVKVANFDHIPIMSLWIKNAVILFCYFKNEI